MKKGIFAMFILVVSMAMVACTNTSTVSEGATTEENQALKVLEKRREYYKAQDKEKAKLEAESKKAEEKAMQEATNQVETTTEEAVTVNEEEAKKAEEKAMQEAAKAKEEAEKEALKILEKKRKEN